MRAVYYRHRKNLARGLVALALLLLCLTAWPTGVFAADAEIRSADITVDLEDDGSGWVTEVWDVTIPEGTTEYYIGKYHLQEQTITDFSVTDETGRQFDNIGRWNSDRSREEKAYQCGLIETNGGYELCWGFGTFGNHTYTVRYRMTNLVKSYDGADALAQWFIRDGAMAPIQQVRLVVRRDNLVFTSANTGVWGFGHTGDIQVQDGEVVSVSTRPVGTNEYVAILVEFDKGMFHPLVTVDKTFEQLLVEGLEGSGYEPGPGDAIPGESTSGWNRFASVIKSIFPFLFVGGMVLLLSDFMVKSGSYPGASTFKKEYKDPPYSRTLPWNGDLIPTYARLEELSKLPGGDGALIGAYLLRWLRAGQIEILQQQDGVFGNKTEENVKLNPPTAAMSQYERQLYDMMTLAAGADGVLQSKEFEKWNRKNYSRMEGWLKSIKMGGHNAMRQLGALAEVETTGFLGIKSRKTRLTPVGEKYTIEMFGFKKYLQDFTIINERQAREVQLWDEYLVFAQIFGIADQVAEQFKQLYPAYFQQPDAYGHAGYYPGMWDILILTRLANSYSRAAYTGYRAGYQAAHTSSYSGGGGGFSGGGGGGFSGGGGGGGGGGAR